jgi:hypothetical protein
MSTDERVRPGRGRTVLAAAAAAVLVAGGEWAVLGGHVAVGAVVIVAAAAVLAADWLLPSGFGSRASSEAPPLAPRRPPAAGPSGLSPRTSALPAATVPVPGAAVADASSSMLARLLGWRPLPAEALRLSRYWLLAPLLPLAVPLQVGLIDGKLVLPVACLVAMGLVAMVYLLDLKSDLVLPSPNENLHAVLLAGLGLPVQALGAWILWQYVYVMSGFFVVVLGGAWTLWCLSRWPLRLALPEEENPGRDEWLAAPQRLFFGWRPWATKAGLVVAAAICCYGALAPFAAVSQSLSVGLGFLGIALLMFSFPWLPGTLGQTLGLRPVTGALLALGLTVLAFVLGLRGEGLVEAGSTTAGLWFFLAAAVAVVLAVAPRPLGGRGAPPEAEPPRWVELALVLGLLATAWAFHFWKIGVFPFGAEGDEAGGGVWAWDILHNNLENPMISGNVPLHFFSVTALFYRCFGLSITTLRLHSVVFGTLSVASAYFFFRLFSGWAAALVATLLMLFSYWHLHYSRFGHYNIEQIFAQMAAFYFVFKGLRSGRYWLFVVGGIAFGLAMQPHLASRLLPFEGIAFVLFLLLTARPNLRRHATGLLAFVVAAWIVSSPSLMYWFRATGISFGRASSVSIFDKTNSNAPLDVVAGFARNCKVSMLMFNQAGDSRSRDNPLAPEKMLESGAAMLFAIAFTCALYHWRQPGRFFLLAVFFINLSASVFSVEAPQGLRTAGNIPIVFALVGLWMGDFSASLGALGRRRGLLVFLALSLPVTTVLCYRSAHKYFVDRAGLGFDAEATYVGMALGQDQSIPVKGLMAVTGFAASHPPVILFRQGAEMRNFYNLAEFVPPAVAPDTDVMLILGDDYQQALPTVRSYFPGVTPQVIHDTSRLGGPDLATTLRVPMAMLAKKQGLHARALVQGRWVEVDNSGLDNSLPSLQGAGRIEWTGALLLKHCGRYRFTPVGGGRTAVRVDGRPLRPQEDAVLALGVHSIQVEWAAPHPGTLFHMEWSGKPVVQGMVFNLNDPLDEAVPKYVLWQDLAPRGFYGRYFTSPDCSGPAVAETVEPVLFAHWLDSPIQGTWSGLWRARFKATAAGRYRFDPRVQAFAEVRVNGILVARRGSPLKAEARVSKVSDGVDLGTGWNTLELRFATTGSPLLELRWSGPGLPEQLMQPDTLEPLRD